MLRWRCWTFLCVYLLVCCHDISADADEAFPTAKPTPAATAPTLAESLSVAASLFNTVDSTSVSSSEKSSSLKAPSCCRNLPESACARPLSNGGRVGFWPSRRVQNEDMNDGAMAAVSTHSANMLYV